MRSYFNALLCVLIVLIAVQASAPDAYDAVVPETDLFQDLDAVNVNDFLVKKTLKESGFFEGERADKTADSDEDTLFKATKAYASTFAQDADADEFADVEEETPYPQTYKELVHETTTPPPPPPSTQQRHEEEAAPDSDRKPANVEETSDGPGSEKDSIITATHATTGFPDGDKPILGYAPDLNGTPLPGNQGHDGGSMPYKAATMSEEELNAIFEPLPQQKPPKKLVEEIPEEDKTLENIGQRIKHKLHRRITKNNWLDNM
jgi:hypothetical protein